jgi:hypothetical protein
VLAASSIRAVNAQQQHVDSVLLYLRNHGQHVHSIDLKGAVCHTVSLQELPHAKLQGLSSLKLCNLDLQLQPGDGFQGVLGAVMPLKRLRFAWCTLHAPRPGQDGLAAALLLLPDLQHLSLDGSGRAKSSLGTCNALQELQQLTYLELSHGWVRDQHGPWQLQQLTRLQDLRLFCGKGDTLQASMLSSLQRLTHFIVHGSYDGGVFEAGALAGKTQLQHFELMGCDNAGGSAGIAELLSHLQPLQQLTHLTLHPCWKTQSLYMAAAPPAAAYSALTASGKLQLLDIAGWPVPTALWQQMFPAGRQLPDLTFLQIGDTSPPTVAEGSRLVSCCPRLRSLRGWCEHGTEKLLGPLTGLSSLSKLVLIHPTGSSPEGLELLCQLTGLIDLELQDPSEDDGVLQQLTHLKQLTRLDYWCRADDSSLRVSAQLGGDTAVQHTNGWQHHAQCETTTYCVLVTLARVCWLLTYTNTCAYFGLRAHSAGNSWGRASVAPNPAAPAEAQ